MANGWVVIALIASLGVMSGCEDPRARLVQHQVAAERSGDRAGTAAALEADFRAGRVTLDLALDHGFVLLDRGEDAYVYVGAILDLAERVSDVIPKSPELSTILLYRIGRLAFRAAESAYLDGRVPLARSLVLSGPARWQNEGYWRRYPDHDALASMLMAATGERAEAMRRLRSRAYLDGPAAEALDLLGKMPP